MGQSSSFVLEEEDPLPPQKTMETVKTSPIQPEINDKHTSMKSLLLYGYCRNIQPQLSHIIPDTICQLLLTYLYIYIQDFYHYLIYLGNCLNQGVYIKKESQSPVRCQIYKNIGCPKFSPELHHSTQMAHGFDIELPHKVHNSIIKKYNGFDGNKTYKSNSYAIMFFVANIDLVVFHSDEFMKYNANNIIGYRWNLKLKANIGYSSSNNALLFSHKYGLVTLQNVNYCHKYGLANSIDVGIFSFSPSNPDYNSLSLHTHNHYRTAYDATERFSVNLGYNHFGYTMFDEDHMMLIAGNTVRLVNLDTMYEMNVAECNQGRIKCGAYRDEMTNRIYIGGGGGQNIEYYDSFKQQWILSKNVFKFADAEYPTIWKNSDDRNILYIAHGDNVMFMDERTRYWRYWSQTIDELYFGSNNQSQGTTLLSVKQPLILH